VARHRSALASVKAMKEGRAKKEAIVQAEFERTFMWGGALVANLPGTTSQSAPLQTAAAQDSAADEQHAPPRQRVRLDEEYTESPSKAVQLPTPYKSALRSDLIESVHRNRTTNANVADEGNEDTKAAVATGGEGPGDNDEQGLARTGGTSPTALRPIFRGNESDISTPRKATVQSDGFAENDDDAPTPQWLMPRGAALMATVEPSATITAKIPTSGLLRDAQAAGQGTAVIFIAPPLTTPSAESNRNVVPPRRASIGLHETPSWTPPQAEPAPPCLPYYYKVTLPLGANRPRASVVPAVGDARGERVDPPRAPVWDGCGLLPPQSSFVVGAVNESAEQQEQQQQEKHLTGGFVLPRSPVVSSSPLCLHGNAVSIYSAPASMGTQGTRSDYAEPAGSGSNSTNTTPTTLGGGLVDCSDEENGDLGSWSVNRSYRMTLDGDESMPDTLAAPRELSKRKDKGGDKLRWSSDSASTAVATQILTAAAAAATTTETAACSGIDASGGGGGGYKFGDGNGNAFSGVHCCGDVDINSKHSEESIEEAQMREAIRARAEELALRAARAEESHLLNVRQAQSRVVMQRRLQEDEGRGYGYSGAAAAVSVPDNGSNSTVSAHTLNHGEHGNSTLEEPTLEREPRSDEQDGQSLSSNEQRIKSRGVGDPNLDRFRCFDDDDDDDDDDDASNGFFRGDTGGIAGRVWPRGGGSGD
jgi:hypothetical protein